MYRGDIDKLVQNYNTINYMSYSHTVVHLSGSNEYLRLRKTSGGKMESRSLIAYGYYIEASRKYDYFLTSIIVAICAYLGQTLHIEKIGLTPNTLKLLSLVVFALAFYYSVKRFEKLAQFHLLDCRIKDLSEEKSMFIQNLDKETFINIHTGDIFKNDAIKKNLAEIEKALSCYEVDSENTGKRAKEFYDLRNWAIMLGFTCHIIAKILEAYI